MLRLPPRSTLTDTLFPYTTLFRAQFNTTKIGEGDVAFALGFPASPVNLGLDLAHFLVGDHKEIAAAARRIEHPDFRHAVAQVQQLAGIIVSRSEEHRLNSSH